MSINCGNSAVKNKMALGLEIATNNPLTNDSRFPWLYFDVSTDFSKIWEDQKWD